MLLGGVTDKPEQAREVARLIGRTGLPAKVNLIAWNPGPGIPFEMPKGGAVETFRRALEGENLPVYLRRPRGRDIFAACGQLKRTIERLEHFCTAPPSGMMARIGPLQGVGGGNQGEPVAELHGVIRCRVA